MFMEFLKVVGVGILSSVCVLLGGFMWEALTDANNSLPDTIRVVLKVVAVFIGISSIILAVACLWMFGCFILDMFI